MSPAINPDVKPWDKSSLTTPITHTVFKPSDLNYDSLNLYICFSATKSKKKRKLCGETGTEFCLMFINQKKSIRDNNNIFPVVAYFNQPSNHWKLNFFFKMNSKIEVLNRDLGLSREDNFHRETSNRQHSSEEYVPLVCLFLVLLKRTQSGSKIPT